jgi:hypothetical protein
MKVASTMPKAIGYVYVCRYNLAGISSAIDIWVSSHEYKLT